MATILRSSKYIRCLNGLAQRIVVAHENNKFVTKSLALQVQCTNSYLSKSYAIIPATESAQDVNFDKLFNKLDENVRRYGRVFKPEVEAVLFKLRDAGYISSLDALLLIRCCGELLVDAVLDDRNKLAQEIWTTFDTLKIRLDVSHFNALLRVYLENDYEFSPIEFLTSMKNKGVEPNRVTYQRLMLYHCKKGDIDRATKILEFMREKGLPLNEGIFNALITGHSEANDMESAKNIMNIMKEAGVKPCSSTYTALLCAYAKQADMESIRETLTKLESEHLYLQNKDFFEIIHVLAANNNNDEINEILAIIPRGSSYNIDAAHAILKVLDFGNIDVALNILSTMKKRHIPEDTVEYASGTFLIKKLVNARYPVEKIVKVCENMEREGKNSRAFAIAVERSLENGDIGLSTKLLEEWRNHGGEIRQHYFWPLLVTHGKASNYQGVINTIKLMSTSFQIVPCIEMIKDYVLPYTLGHWDEIIPALRELQIVHSTITTAIASRMLFENRIRKTAIFMMNYPSEYEAKYFYQLLANAVIVTGDASSYTVILRCLYEAAVCSNKSSEHEKSSLQENIVDNAIQTLLKKSSRNYQIVNTILERLVEFGLSISPEVGVELRQYFQNNMNPLTVERIENLTSGTLTPVPVEELKSITLPGESGEHDNNGRVFKIDERLHFGIRRNQLQAALKNEDIKTTKDIIKELESLNFEFSLALCAQIIEIACTYENMEMAEEWVNKARANSSDFSLDFQKVIKYAELLIKNARFDDAVQFIQELPRKDNFEMQALNMKRLVKHLLEVAVEISNVEKINVLFQALLKSNYLMIDNYMLGPLVKIHIDRDNLESALEAFEKACKDYQCTPMKNELSKRFIDTEDASSLQKLTDLSTAIHGENNALVDLVLSFIECGRLRQARKILETPGLKVSAKKLRVLIDRYVKASNIEYLEQFTDITKGLPVIDRRQFYEILMNAYAKKNNWQQGLALWTAIQDEDLQPSNSFLRTLAHLLKINRQSVPFQYNDLSEIDSDMQEDQDPSKFQLAKLYTALQHKELETAEKYLEIVPPNHPKLVDATSRLIDSFISQKNDLDKASKLLEDLIVKRDLLPPAACVKSVWNSFVEAGEFEKLKKHGNALDTNTKGKLRFHQYLKRAELKKLGLTEFLANFESKLTDSKTDNLKIVKQNLPYTSLIEEFKTHPEAVEKFHQLAERLSEQEIYLPINLVWSYYFEQNHPEAEAVWNKHLSSIDHVMFKYIIGRSHRTNDIELMERLFEKLWTHNHLTPDSKVLVLNAIIELYNKNSRYEDALKIVESLPPSIVKMWIGRNPVEYEELREGLEAKGISFFMEFDDTKQVEQ